VIKREHFNRWYSVRAYYLALVIGDLPIQIFCTVSYILITYFLTSQPLELFRFAGFFTINLLVCFVAQGLGILVSSIFNVKLGTIFGTFFICPFLIFSGFFVQLKHAPAVSHWLFHISFLKYAMEGELSSFLCFSLLISNNSSFQAASTPSSAFTATSFHATTTCSTTADTPTPTNCSATSDYKTAR
jgi:ABC-type multidrug transport system permease subunit